MATYDNLADIRRKFSDKTVVFCSGTFDLTHAGHILFFEECKKLGDVLVAATGNDETTKRLKGGLRPVFNQHMRLKILSSLRPIDHCFVHKGPVDGSPYHNSFLEEIFEKLHPDKYVINSEASEIPYRQELARRFNIEFVVLERTCPPEFGGISTTKIIEKLQQFSEA